MNTSRGNLVVAIIPISILVFVAAFGWYFYYSEIDKNESLTNDNLAEQKKLGNKLEKSQTTVNKLQERNTKLQKSLAEEADRQKGLFAKMQSISSEKKLVQETLQSKTDSLSEDKKRLESHLLSKELSQKKLQSKLETMQSRIDTLIKDRNDLQARLTSEEESKAALLTSLENTRIEKMTMQDTLQQEVQQATSTTSKLKTEIQKQQATQRTLNNEFISINEEKSRLITQLQIEQEKKKRIGNLKTRLEEELNESRVEISQLKDQMTVIKLTNEVLFGSGSAKLKPAGQKVLSVIADTLNTYPDRAISVEGHTDDLTIMQNRLYESNWELSAARGLAAVYFFQRNKQVDPKRLRVVGYGPYQPMSSNETAAGRKLNRRIEIKLLPPGSVDATRN